jgi:hypothetical protein
LERKEFRSTNHLHDFSVNGIGKDASTSRDVVDEFVESAALHFFALDVRHGVQEIERDRALA